MAIIERTDCIVIYRKDDKGAKYNKDQYKKAPTAAQIREATESLELIARVSRDEVVDFFTNGGFYALPALSSKVIDNKGVRLVKHREDCWIVPVGSLGRNPAITRSNAQSLVIWIKNNLGHVVNPDHVSIVIQPMSIDRAMKDGGIVNN